MKAGSGLAGVRVAQFHTTRWTLVMLSAQSQVEGGRTASAELCQLYWYPLYFFGRPRGYPPTAEGRIIL